MEASPEEGKRNLTLQGALTSVYFGTEVNLWTHRLHNTVCFDFPILPCIGIVLATDFLLYYILKHDPIVFADNMTMDEEFVSCYV
jgi:hypothetical protein